MTLFLDPKSMFSSTHPQKISKSHHKWRSYWIQNPCFLQPSPRKISKSHHKWRSYWIHLFFFKTSPKTHHKWRSYWIRNPCFLLPPPQKKSQNHTINDALIGSEDHFYLKILEISILTGNWKEIVSFFKVSYKTNEIRALWWKSGNSIFRWAS